MTLFGMEFCKTPAAAVPRVLLIESDAVREGTSDCFMYYIVYGDAYQNSK